MNPPDGQWINLTVTVAKQDDGSYAGTMHVGVAGWHVRGWHKGADGVLRAEICAPSDPVWDAVMDQMGSKVWAG